MTRGVGGHSPANIMKHLGGIDFPATKQQLLEHAKETGQKDEAAPDSNEVVEFLEKIPDKKYESVVEVTEAIGEVE
jgi:hypothetical protein